MLNRRIRRRVSCSIRCSAPALTTMRTGIRLGTARRSRRRKLATCPSSELSVDGRTDKNRGNIDGSAAEGRKSVGTAGDMVRVGALRSGGG